jgi:hypothetical protein
LTQQTASDVFRSLGVTYRLQPTTPTESAGFTIASSTGFLLESSNNKSDLVLVIVPDPFTPARHVTVDIRGANIVSATLDRKKIDHLGSRVNVEMDWPPKRRDLTLELAGVIADDIVTVDSWNQTGTTQKQIQLKVRKHE